MKFQEFPYTHQDLEACRTQISSIRSRLLEAQSYDAFLDAFKDLNTFFKTLSTNAELAGIRHTVDTSDSYYDEELRYYDKVLPVIKKDLAEIKNIILNSPFEKDLHKDVPETWFQAAEIDRDIYIPELVEDMQEDNRLATQYQALVASAKIDLDGKTYTLASLGALQNDGCRETREKAHKAYWQWFADHEQEIGDIFDQMVKVRTRMAKKLGYENFIPLGYKHMHRLDYDQKDVENYRKQILEDIVPLCNMLYERQRKRLGLDTLHTWDEKVEFKTGAPKPVMDTPGKIETARRMFAELSPETGEFFNFIADLDCLDLDAKPNKAAGGYCTSLPDFNTPFIFANFSGTAQDLETMTHESGHAFQGYQSRDIFPMDCAYPTMESCEIHSMSMEFFTYPWMPLFFGDDADRYYFNHLSGAVKFLPYGVLVDHFQHEVYAHPEMSHEERMATWRRLEKMYLPHKNYEGIDFLERGGWWMRQLHIFMNPFYYIDYTLAQVCALQFWNRLQKQDPQAFEDYKKICALGGTLPFRSIVKEAGLKVPFEDGCLKETAKAVTEWFEGQDDSRY